jgi:beta-glucosidase
MKIGGQIMNSFKLPGGFLIGTATSSLQIEGGDRNNSWYRWAEEGHIKDGTHSVNAVDHWNRVEEDIEIMKKLNTQTYRLSIEWSRIEPERGKFNKEAIDHYRWEIEKLMEAGIKPLVTLHHFTNPLWLEDNGAWVNHESVDLFRRYTEYVVTYLGDIVSDWITINEPNVYMTSSYLFGTWPPGEKSISKFIKGSRNMILAHIKAYNTIHRVREGMNQKDTIVGVANHLRIFDPKKKTPLNKWVSNIYDRIFQEMFIIGMTEGKLVFPLGSGYPLEKGRYYDFIGINYYSRDIISFKMDFANLFSKREVLEDSKVNDLGWEIYPEGIYRICKKYYDRLKAPIFITENGTSDDKDKFRIKYIYDHIYQIKKLIDDGIDVQRYYHWSLMDNFEWLEGLNSKFGLVSINPDTYERKVKKSGSFYSELCREKGVTEEMIKEYL